MGCCSNCKTGITKINDLGDGIAHIVFDCGREILITSEIVPIGEGSVEIEPCKNKNNWKTQMYETCPWCASKNTFTFINTDANGNPSEWEYFGCHVCQSVWRDNVFYSNPIIEEEGNPNYRR